MTSTGVYRRPIMTPIMASAGSAYSHYTDHLITMSVRMATAIPRCQNRFIRGQASNKTENTANQPPASVLEKPVTYPKIAEAKTAPVSVQANSMCTLSMRDAERWSTSAALNALPSSAGTPCSAGSPSNWVVVYCLIG